MFDLIDRPRRDFVGHITLGLAATTGFALLGGNAAAGKQVTPARGLGRTQFAHAKQIRAGQLDVGYFEFGPENGAPVLLLHGFPYDVHSYVEVAPLLASRGCRVIVPHLRGHGSTRIVDNDTPRSGQQGALGADVIALMDALQLPNAVLAGYDWGGRAACVVAALWPERSSGLVSVNSYLIQDIAKAAVPLPAKVEMGSVVPALFPERARPRRPRRESARSRKNLVEKQLADMGVR